MTGVLEVAAASAAIAAFARSRHEKERQEERVASELYRRFFHADILERSPDRASVAGQLQGLDANAVAAVRAIERYQKERKHWFLGMSSSADHVGDTRTRVLEEMKQWFLTVSDSGCSLSREEVSTRLDYCWQFLLRASAFESQNQTSFLATLGEVSRHMERLFQQTVANQRTGEAQIEQLLAIGRELVEASLPALLFSLPSPSSSSTATSPPDSQPAFGELLAASAEACDGTAAGEEDASSASASVKWTTDYGRLLQALLQEEHVQRLGVSDEEAEQSCPASPSQGSASQRSCLASVLEEVRARWDVERVSSQESGLLDAFCDADRLEARQAYAELCCQLDRLCFFFGALRPYRRVAGAGGDAALCWLRRSLGHLLQELERSLVQLRQARLSVMLAAKRHLQDLSKKLPSISPDDVRWMQGLRHVDELRLDKLHKALAACCAEVNSLASAAREVELKAAAKQGLQTIASGFMSADFQARCSLALPERLAADMRQLAAGPATPTSVLPSIVNS